MESYHAQRNFGPRTFIKFTTTCNFSRTLKEGAHMTKEGNLQSYIVFSGYVYRGKDRQTGQSTYDSFVFCAYGENAEMIRNVQPKTPISIEGYIKNHTFVDQTTGKHVSKDRMIVSVLVVGNERLNSPEQTLKNELNAIRKPEEETVELL